MALPTATEIRSFLEGYNVTTTILSDTWITTRLNSFVIPFVENVTKLSLSGEETVIEYLSGNGEGLLLLSRRPVNSLVSIEYVNSGDIESTIDVNPMVLLADEGIIKSTSNISEGNYNNVFRKGKRNIKVTYKAGFATIPDSLKEAIIHLASEQILGFVGARTGGGSLNGEGFGRAYGVRGKYQDIRNDLQRSGMFLLKKYITYTVGSVS